MASATSTSSPTTATEKTRYATRPWSRQQLYVYCMSLLCLLASASFLSYAEDQIPNAATALGKSEADTAVSASSSSSKISLSPLATSLLSIPCNSKNLPAGCVPLAKPCRSDGGPAGCDSTRIQPCGTIQALLSQATALAATMTPSSARSAAQAVAGIQSLEVIPVNTNTDCKTRTSGAVSDGQPFIVQFAGADGVCHEIITTVGEDFGVNSVNNGDYNCNGRCGPGCGGSVCSNWAKDCLRHDMCSNYFSSGGGIFDKNCGRAFRQAADDYLSAGCPCKLLAAI